VTSAGTVYVADTGNHTLRVVDLRRAVTTLAGAAGSVRHRRRLAARRASPIPTASPSTARGIFTSPITTINTIRKMNPAGGVTTLAGAAGIPGSADGAGGAARFNGPTGVAVDGSGNVYVADAGNTSIRKITANGVVTTFAGVSGVAGSSDGLGAAARFNAPQGIAVDSAGNVYVADTNNSTIRKMTAGGRSRRSPVSAGQTGSGDGPAAPPASTALTPWRWTAAAMSMSRISSTRRSARSPWRRAR
jgi:sugar lactone lactonase YvrE